MTPGIDIKLFEPPPEDHASRRWEIFRSRDVDRFCREQVKTIRPSISCEGGDALARANGTRNLFDGFMLTHYIGPVDAMVIVFRREHVALIVRCVVLSRDRREIICTKTESRIGIDDLESHAVAREFIRTALAEVHQHELDECLYDGGQRCFDPHHGEPR